jgi:2',3'-cyclic-nucleotide 2'-phosphodiesterase (5'-nucleotidase family)
LLQQQRAEAEHVLLLDTGDALIGGGVLGDQTQGAAIVAGMNLMGYDAMALGPKELSLGVDVLRQRLAEARFPMLSANVVLSGTDELLTQPYVIKEIAGFRVAIIGLTRVPKDMPAGFQVLAAQEAAAHYVAEAAQEADTIVLLTNVGYEQVLQWQGVLSDVDLVVAALPKQTPQQAVRVPGTRTLAVSSEMPLQRHTGRVVGKLTVTVESDGHLGLESWEAMLLVKGYGDDPLMTALLNGYR